MSDGPHRSLPLRRAWKKVCEIADGKANTLDEVVERIPEALAADVRGEVSETLLKRLHRALLPDQPGLIDDAAQQVAALRRQAISVMEIDLVEAVGDALRDGRSKLDALREGVDAVLEERAEAVKRAVVEHYLRRTPQARAKHVEGRLSEAIGRAKDGLSALANGLAAGSLKLAGPRPTDRSGLEDGPALA